MFDNPRVRGLLEAGTEFGITITSTASSLLTQDPVLTKGKGRGSWNKVRLQHRFWATKT